MTQRKKSPPKSAGKPLGLEVLPLAGIYRLVRKLVVLVIGGSVLLFGVALIFLPGPAIVVIPVGLTILATEFIWARRLLKQLKTKLGEMREKIGHRALDFRRGASKKK